MTARGGLDLARISQKNDSRCLKFRLTQGNLR